MDVIDHLARKVKQAAEELTTLKMERQKLLGELETLREESKKFNDALRENERLRKDQSRLRVKLERLDQKLEKLFSAEIRSAHQLQEVEPS